jgi:hypothetical protein
MKFEADRAPSGPLLQADPVADLLAFRAEEEKALSSYAWVDEGQGKVRIPVEEAMRILAERGMPATAPEPSPAGKAR